MNFKILPSGVAVSPSAITGIDISDVFDDKFSVTVQTSSHCYHADTFDNKFDAEKYAAERGSIRDVLSSYITDNGEKLGLWVAQQRRIRKGNIKHSVIMTDERIAMLDKIGMNWGKLFDQNDQKTK